MQQKLNLLIDKKFNYKDKIINITKWKKVGVTYVVFTDKQTYNFFENEIDLFIEHKTRNPVTMSFVIIDFSNINLNEDLGATLSILNSIAIILMAIIFKIKLSNKVIVSKPSK